MQRRHPFRLLKPPLILAGALLVLAQFSAQAAPPQLPDRFSKETVTRLLESIDQGQNALILQFGYFLRRDPQGLNVSDGMALLKQVIQDEPVGSKRWLMLKSVQGFAGLRAGTDNVSSGLDAYQELFGQTDVALKTGSSEIVKRAIREFIATVPTNFGRPINGQRGRQLVLLALDSYLKLLTNQPDLPRGRGWSKAVGMTYGDDQAIAIVENAASDSKLAASYSFWRLAADVARETQPEKSLSFLQKARSVAPKDEDGFEETRSLYQDLVDLLVSRNRLSDAITEQKKLSQITGQDQGRLIVLYHMDTNIKEAELLVENLASQGAEQEINATAKSLLSLLSKETTAIYAFDAGIKLLRSYLASTRTRRIDQELRARLSLGESLMKAGRVDEAKGVLSVVYTQPPPSPVAQSYYADIRRLLATVEKGGIQPRATIKTQAENTTR